MEAEAWKLLRKTEESLVRLRLSTLKLNVVMQVLPLLAIAASTAVMFLMSLGRTTISAPDVKVVNFMFHSSIIFPSRHL